MRWYPQGAPPPQRVALRTCTLELYDRKAKVSHERVTMTPREAELLRYGGPTSCWRSGNCLTRI